MFSLAIDRARKLNQDVSRLLLRGRVWRALHGSGVSIVSSNCLGGRLSRLAREPYRSPTVGLWFRPDDFIKFATEISRYVEAELTHEVQESASLGYPVGRLADIKVLFMHYPSFAEARDHWIKRAARIDMRKLLLVFTDRDNATIDHLTQFDKLPYSKLLFVSRDDLNLASAICVRDGNEKDQVGDLTSQWHHLAPVLTRSILRRIRQELNSD